MKNSSDNAVEQLSPGAPWQLAILQGLHKGAVVDLPAGGMLLLGCSTECDVRLADEGVRGQHIALMKHGNGMVVKGLEGAADCAGRTIESGNQYEIEAGQSIRLMPSAVEIQLVAYQQNDAANHNADGISDEVSSDTRWFGLAAFALCLVLTASFGSFVWDGANANDEIETEISDIEALKALLNQLNLGSAVQLEKKASHILIHGILTQSQSESLFSALKEQTITYRLRIKTIDQLLEQIGNVFRINGYGAKLRYLGEAKVEVQNLDGNNSKIQQVAEYVKKDVTDLAVLQFAEYQPVSDAGGDATYHLDAGKRLTAVVDGDTAYVAALDGSRYFVGSLLPGGYSIRHIRADGVQVDKQGELTWLYF